MSKATNKHTRTTRAGILRRQQVGAEGFSAFIPKQLPPKPPIDLGLLQPALDRATNALGRIDGVALMLPDPDLILYSYVRKEAVLSSQIEGTQLEGPHSRVHAL